MIKNKKSKRLKLKKQRGGASKVELQLTFNETLAPTDVKLRSMKSLYLRSMGDKKKDGFSLNGVKHWKKITNDDPNSDPGRLATKKSVQKMENDYINSKDEKGESIFQDYDGSDIEFAISPKFLFYDAGKYSLFTLGMETEKRYIVVTPAALIDPATNWTDTKFNQIWPKPGSDTVQGSKIILKKEFMNVFLGTSGNKNLDIYHETGWIMRDDTENIDAHGDRKYPTKYAEDRCMFKMRYKRNGDTVVEELKKEPTYRRLYSVDDKMTEIFHDSIDRSLPVTASNHKKTLYDDDVESSFESHMGKELGDAIQAVHMFIFASIYIEYGDGIDENKWESGNIFTFNFGEITLSYEDGEIILKIENTPTMAVGNLKTSEIIDDDEKEKTIKRRKSQILMTTGDGNVVWLVGAIFNLAVYYSSDKRIYCGNIESEHYIQQIKKTIVANRIIRKIQQIKMINKIQEKLKVVKNGDSNIKKSISGDLIDIYSFRESDDVLKTHIGIGDNFRYVKLLSDVQYKEIIVPLIKLLSVAIKYFKGIIINSDPENIYFDENNKVTNSDALSYDFFRLVVTTESGNSPIDICQPIKGKTGLLIDTKIDVLIDEKKDNHELYKVLKEIISLYGRTDISKLSREPSDLENYEETIKSDIEKLREKMIEATRKSYGKINALRGKRLIGGGESKVKNEDSRTPRARPSRPLRSPPPPPAQLNMEEIDDLFDDETDEYIYFESLFIKNAYTEPKDVDNHTSYLNNMINSPIKESLKHSDLVDENKYKWILDLNEYDENLSFSEINEYLKSGEKGELKVTVPFEHAYTFAGDTSLSKNERLKVLEYCYKCMRKILSSREPPESSAPPPIKKSSAKKFSVKKPPFRISKNNSNTTRTRKQEKEKVNEYFKKVLLSPKKRITRRL